MTDFAARRDADRAQTRRRAPRTPPAPTQQTIRRSATVVGSVNDPAERDADAVADQVLRALAAPSTASAPAGPADRIQRAHAATPPAGGAPAELVQRSTATGGEVIRRKIGNQGNPHVGKQVRKLTDPGKGKLGTIKSWNYGGGLWGVTGVVGISNVVYVVEFPGEKPASITADDDDYELVTGAPVVPEKEKGASTTTPAKAARDLEADAKTTGALEALIARLGEPLTGMKDTNGLSHSARKELLQELQTAKSAPEKLPDGPALEALTKRVDGVETTFREFAVKTAAARQEKAKAAADEKQKLEDAAKTAKAEQELEKANKVRAGNLFGQLKAQVPEATALAELLKATPLGDEGQLLSCVQGYDVEQLRVLFTRAIKPKDANRLLGYMNTRAVAQLTELLDHIQPGELGRLETLITRTADDKATLVKLLTKLGNNATEALKLMSKASDGAEASVLAMLDAGRSTTDTATLVDTVSGRTDTADAATVSTGVADVGTAKTLLDQPGVSGSATEALAVLKHATVGNDIAKATPLLNKEGNAADALALLKHGCTLVDAGKLLATTGIKAAGADAVWCLQQGCSVADLATLLAVRTATEIRSYKAAGFRFDFVKAELAITPTQQFWAGETCAAPAFTGPLTSINAIIAAATHPPSVGDYSGGNRFGNHGRVDGDGHPVMFLPPGTYREYDLKPFASSAERGKRRIVCDGANRFYTDDHYQTFKKFP